MKSIPISDNNASQSTHRKGHRYCKLKIVFVFLLIFSPISSLNVREIHLI